jgi:hypothetical protein
MDNELFDGIQIMSPQELEQSLSKTPEGSSDDTTNDTPAATGNEEFTLEPVVSQRGEGATENKVITEDTPPANEQKGEAVYKALMKELVNEGILTVAEVEKLDELPGNFDTIKKLLTETIDGKMSEKEASWKGSFTGAKKRFLEIEDAFTDADQAIVMAQRLEFFDNLSEDAVKQDVNLQKQLYYEQLKAKNFSDADAKEAIEDAEAIDKLSEKALKALPELRQTSAKVVEDARAAKEEQTQAQKDAQEKAFQNLLEAVEKKDQFVDGLSLNKVSKDKLKNNIIKPVYTDPKTGQEYNSLMYKQMKNPAEFEMLINYYDTLGLFDITDKGTFKPNISKLKAVAKTSAITELDKVIANEEERGVGRNTSVETSQKTKSALDLLERAFSKR